VEGREQTIDLMVRAVAVGDRYFETMRIPLRSGRGLEEADGAGRPRVAVISETLARREFPNENPIGKRFTADLRAPAETTFRIVGVAGDANLKDPRDAEHRECVYFRYEQWAFPPQAMVAQVRLAPGVSAAVAADRLREALRGLDPALAFYGVQTIEQASETLLASERLAALLTAFFGGSAALLFAVGIHGVVARSLAMREKEAAIRVALGGRARQVVWALARGPLWCAGAGAAAGTAILAVAVQGKVDLASVAGAVSILVVMAAAALAAPAWRVRTMQPAAVLKKD